MIPLLAVVRVDGLVRFRLWLPLFLIWILLLPFALVLVPFVLLLLVVHGAAIWPVLRSVFEALSGMRGTHVEVCTPQNHVFVHVW